MIIKNAATQQHQALPIHNQNTYFSYFFDIAKLINECFSFNFIHFDDNSLELLPVAPFQKQLQHQHGFIHFHHCVACEAELNVIVVIDQVSVYSTLEY